ncbi:MAG: hypothetical protein A2070_09855 [Bdellovibrionales bacterium GWC1_52_8]|nr:MAG: hypothetical protein A2070_09855 [Bdellovibrionales bacterium GWC1_52_8]
MTDQNLTERPPRKHPMELQLTALIDVFSMIVIFLILGTVFGASEVVIPGQMKLPKSISKEGMDTAPRIVIHQGKVTSNFFKESYDLSRFHASEGSEESEAFKRELKKHVKVFTSGEGPKLLSTIADQEAAYEDVFSVVRLFRLAGFETLLFVATGEGITQ